MKARIDLIHVAAEQPVGYDPDADKEIVRGVPVEGATLENLRGAPSAPAGRIPFAYMIVPDADE